MHIRNRYLFLIDAALLTTVVFLGFAVRLEEMFWEPGYSRTAITFAAASVPLKLLVFWSMGLYRRLWAYAGSHDLERILVAGFVAGVAAFPVGAFVLPAFGLTPVRVPLSVLAWTWVLGIFVAAGPRWLIRMYQHRGIERRRRHRRREELNRTLIVGAGRAGAMVAREVLRSAELSFEPVGFLDDDRAKHGHDLLGLPVLGAIADLPAVVDAQGVTNIVIAIPTAPGRKIREVVEAARAAGVRVRTVPGLFEILSGRKSVNALRDVQIEDLLRREPVTTDLARIREIASRETVLVTGAGGSIGSELCRQLAGLAPARLVLLGHGENSIFEVANELAKRFPEVPQVRVIADVRNRAQLSEIWQRYRPFAVFHAAAHKHVPLMEENLAEAITNNILGTRNVLEVSIESGVEHLVMISTDKAVRPTNVMGATKRVAEQLVQAAAEESGRNFVAVRFGNVLGSRGSVVPTFLRQIAEGGPVTITHPEMSRYFMTIPEAVQLVLQAAAIGSGGEVFVLDMGGPVKIADLAADLIRLSGLEVGRDIELRFTGLRPGEKLREELFFDAEHALPTYHPKVLRAQHAALPPGLATVIDDLIKRAVDGASESELRRCLVELVPDFSSSEQGPPAPGVTLPLAS